jgi:tRNA(Ile)-lysidine synthase
VSLAGTVARTVRRHAMLDGGDIVLVAVSGGADSVALLLLLRELAPELGVALRVAHVDHRLRADAAAHADFVVALGARLGLPVEVLPVSVPAGGSLEDSARRVRYAALEACAARAGARRIATGHTADDQAETVLMRVLEGAGPRGLAGIPPVRGAIVRPLIEVRRAALRAHLEAAGERWVEDPSNQDRRFLRNRIRHELLPALAAAVPDAADALARTARLARATVEALDRAAAAALAAAEAAEPGGVTVRLAALRGQPPEVAAETLRLAADRMGGRAPLRAWAHRGLRRVLADPPLRRAFHLGGVRVEVSCGMVRLATAAPPALEERRLRVPGGVDLPEIGARLTVRLVSRTGYAVPRDPCRTAFDADGLPPALTVRARRAGDRFAPFGGREQALKDFLINAKIPRWRRPSTPLVEGGGDIVWVAGVRRGAAAPVTAATVRVAEMALEPLADPGPGR